MSNFNYSSRLTETMILGNLALRAGSRSRVGRQEPGRDEQSRGKQIRPPRVSCRLFRLNDAIDSQARGLPSAGFFS